MSTKDTHATYIQTRPISNALGRLNYATNPECQEHLLAVHSTIPDSDATAYWTQAAKDSRRAWLRHGGPARGTRCREAQEIIATLPRCSHVHSYKWLAMAIAQLFLRSSGQHCTVALHASHNEDNIHVHILFSPRRCVPVHDYVSLTTYKDAAGNIVDRTDVYDADGHLLPGCTVWYTSSPVSGYTFGPCDPVLGDYVRYQDFAYYLIDWVNTVLQPEKPYVVRGKWSPYLPQQHIGKRAGALLAERIRQCNALAQAINRLIDNGTIPWEEAQDIKTEVLTAATRAEVMQRILLGLLLDGRISADDVAGTVLEGIPAAKYADTHHAMVIASNPKPMPAGTDPDKVELRRLYAERAKAYDDAYANPTAAGRNYFLSNVAAYTLQINRLRRKLGIYYTADHARTMQELDAATRYWRSQVLCLRRQYDLAKAAHDQLRERCAYYDSRIPRHPTTWQEHARAAKFDAKANALLLPMLDAEHEAYWALIEYQQAVRAAKDTHETYKAEQWEYAIYTVRSTIRNITYAVTPSHTKQQNTHDPEQPLNHTPLAHTNGQTKDDRKPSLDSIIGNAASRRGSQAPTTHHQRAADMGAR